MRTSHIGWVLLLSISCAAAQAPVQDLGRDQAIQRGQQRAGAAYSELREARYQAKIAEQEHLNALEAQRIAQRQADETKRRLEAAKKALDEAKAREAKARKAYDEALTAVDEAFKNPPAK